MTAMQFPSSLCCLGHQNDGAMVDGLDPVIELGQGVPAFLFEECTRVNSFVHTMYRQHDTHVVQLVNQPEVGTR